MLKLLSAAVFAAAYLSFVITAQAGTFYVDPANGNDQNDGSQNQPWRTLNALKNPKLVKSGDTVLLRDGFYGDLIIYDRNNTSMITITAAEGHSARFTRIQIGKSKNWHLKGLSVSQSFGPSSVKNPLIANGSDSSQIIYENISANSAPDSSAWSADDWKKKAANGFFVRGSHIKVLNSKLKNIAHAITNQARHADISNNTISNFSGDGIRALGDDSIYKNNVISDCYMVDENHDDGIQSWTVGTDGKVGTGEVTNVLISGNTIIGVTDEKRDLPCSLQGIGLFDGMFVNWRIENNIVVTDHWHGIAIAGAENVHVVNNTVVDPKATKHNAPWIAVTAHKNGTPSKASVIANNVAVSYKRAARDAGLWVKPEEIMIKNNVSIQNPNLHFEDVARYNFKPLKGSPIINAGAAEYAPDRDITGIKRPQGARVDAGAHQSR